MTTVVYDTVSSPPSSPPLLSRSVSSPPPLLSRSQRLSPERRCSPGSESDSPSRSRSRSNSPPIKSRSRWSRGRSPSPPPVDSFPQFSAAPASTVGGEEPAGTLPILDDKVLFIFFTYSTTSPFSYCLVRVSSSDLSSSDSYSEIKPVLQFPLKEFPLLMRCIEFNSKLYFLGGEMEPNICKVPNPKYTRYYPPEVYVVDTDRLTAVGNTINEPHQLLKIGPPMNSGKPDPYVFEACGKIYVMSGDEVFGSYYYDGDELEHYESDEYYEFDEFEVYDPVNGWSVLPVPPMDDESLTGHAVVGREVIMVTRYPKIFLFNVDTHAWKKLSASIPSSIGFDAKVEFVDGAFYTTWYALSTLVAYCKGDKGLFDHVAVMPRETLDAYGKVSVCNCSRYYLVHLGGRKFCHVIAGDSTIPLDEPLVTSHPRLGIFLAFLDMGEIYEETTGEHILPAKVLQTFRLVTPNTIGEEPLLRDCFMVSSVSALR